MMNKPFNIKTFLFDCLLALTTFIVAEIISLLILAVFFKINLEEDFALSFYIGMPLWSVLFYLIRRRFNFKITIIQIAFTSIVTFLLSGLLIMSIDHWPGVIGSQYAFLVPLICIVVFVLSKHLGDWWVMRKERNF